MTSKRRPRITAPVLVVLGLILVLAVACGTSNPAPSPSASPKASAPPPSAAPASPVASAKTLSPQEQAWQKAQEDWKQVVEAARKEGEATIYSVFAQNILDMLQKEFNKVDPKIQVKLIRAAGAVAIERLRAEQSTKQYVGNAYFGGTSRLMAKEGLAQPVDLLVTHDPSIKWLIDPLMDKPLPTVVSSFNTFTLIYNSSLVPADQAPQVWKDLADPKWKNKLALWNLHTSGTAQTLLCLLYLDPNYGPDVVRKIVENAVMVADNGEAARTVVKGEALVGLTSYGEYQNVKEGPVKLIHAKDGTAGNPSPAFLVKNAPQPNTGRVFLNWLLEKDAQKIFGIGYTIVRSDVQADAKEIQLQPGQKFLANVPPTAEFELGPQTEPAKVIEKWLTELGK